MRIEVATDNDISELYNLQLLAFESEALMIGSRDVPALQETIEQYKKDYVNWTTLKMLNDSNLIIGAIRYRLVGDIVEVGRLMIHPDYRLQGFAGQLLEEVNKTYPAQIKELYTCTKSWTNIRLYKKMGYVPYKEVTQNNGLAFIYMRKNR